MAGGALDHAALALRIGGLIDAALGDRPCRAFSSDARVRIEAANRSVYPDVTVVCGKVQPASDDRHAITNPTLIVEVLADASEAYDRGEKFRYDKRLPSLVEYVLVSQREPLVEICRREGQAWTVTEHGPGSAVRLASLDVSFSVDALYRNPAATA